MKRGNIRANIYPLMDQPIWVLILFHLITDQTLLCLYVCIYVVKYAKLTNKNIYDFYWNLNDTCMHGCISGFMVVVMMIDGEGNDKSTNWISIYEYDIYTWNLRHAPTFWDTRKQYNASINPPISCFTSTLTSIYYIIY